LSGVANLVYTDQQGDENVVTQLRAGSVLGVSNLLEIGVSSTEFNLYRVWNF